MITFLQKELQANCAAIFVNVSTSLVNDPQPECRKQAAQIIGLLLGRIDNNCKDKLFDVTKLWLEDSKVKYHKKLLNKGLRKKYWYQLKSPSFLRFLEKSSTSGCSDYWAVRCSRKREI